jgi:hypothetical protein
MLSHFDDYMELEKQDAAETSRKNDDSGLTAGWPVKRKYIFQTIHAPKYTHYS